MGATKIKEKADEVKTETQTVEEPKEITTESEAEKLAAAIDSFMLGANLTAKLKPEQIQLCKMTAAAFKLNPLKREIHFVPRKVKRKNPQTGYWEETGDYEVSVIIGYEVYLKRAQATGKLSGWSTKFEGVGPTLKCIVTINRKDWDNPFMHEVWAVESSEDTPIWKKRPRFMLEKVAIGQGFRLCFPEELGGMPYTPEEIGIGTAENGKLITEPEKQEALPAPQPAPVPTKPEPPKTPVYLISPRQQGKIMSELRRTGKTSDPILKFYNVPALSKLTEGQAESTIAKLKTLPNAEVQDKGDTVIINGKPEEHVDPDEVAKGIDEQKLEAATQKELEL